jgi:hypothetical protein
MTEWMLWIAIAGGGQALELNRFETKAECEQVHQGMTYTLREAGSGSLPPKLVHECSEVEKAPLKATELP